MSSTTTAKKRRIAKQAQPAEPALPDSVTIATHAFIYLQYRTLLYAQKLHEEQEELLSASEGQGMTPRVIQSMKNARAQLHEVVKEVAWDVKWNFERALEERLDLRSKYHHEIQKCDSIIETMIFKRIAWKTEVAVEKINSDEEGELNSKDDEIVEYEAPLHAAGRPRPIIPSTIDPGKEHIERQWAKEYGYPYRDEQGVLHNIPKDN